MSPGRTLSLRRRRGLVAGLAGLAGLGAAAAATSGAALRVMVNEVAPYSMRRGEQIVGMHPEMVRAIFEQAEEPIVLNTALYARVSRALRDEVADVVVALEGPDLDAQGLRLGALHPVRMLILPRKGLVLNQVAQLRGLTLGVARGAFYGDSINNDAEIKKFPLPDPFTGVRMLALGRLDAVISTDYLLTHALRQEAVQREAFGAALVYGDAAYALYGRRDLPPERVARLRAAVARLQRQGRLEALVRPYE
ncbi:ABC-type amino acid transport substrate-binding protein [Inhella inkyongensis]|uniref:ABC-type amino acid transport substrate-binding protein n=1 Tax=Inhella inkyongensis TaxID=392593 RepID=A0A840S962_9BURK|nr:transporter substrate-binding domain-containing protein [Inhella inkyongensis]MBB5206152.1 ABC-type amino acid transport substrate-binding protein [Inhella inkyongensis]